MKKLWKGIVNAVKFFIEVLRALEYEAKHRYDGRSE